MTVDWSRLCPLVPAGGDGENAYVQPPHRTADLLASLVGERGRRVALWGPVGSGKSTELGHAMTRMRARVLVSLVPLDTALDLRRAPTEWELHAALVEGLLLAVDVARLTLSPPMLTRLRRFGYGGGATTAGASLPGPDLTRELLVELQRTRPVALLLDGLEKCPPVVAREVLREVMGFTDIGASLVAVVSPALITGPEAYEVVTDLAFREVALRAVPVSARHGEAGRTGREFLTTIAHLRVDIGDRRPDVASLFERAAELSGGIPRIFLQLLRDAATSASFAARPLPDETDLALAVRDHRLTMRRLLRDGDIEVLEAHAGTAGEEIPVERRARLLAHGLLLEYLLPDQLDPVVEPHPLLGLRV